MQLAVTSAQLEPGYQPGSLLLKLQVVRATTPKPGYKQDAHVREVRAEGLVMPRRRREEATSSPTVLQGTRLQQISAFPTAPSQGLRVAIPHGR